MKQIMWWTYGLTGKECKRIFPELSSEIESYHKITYVRRNKAGRYIFRNTEVMSEEEGERQDFEAKLEIFDAEEQFIEGLVGVI